MLTGDEEVTVSPIFPFWVTTKLLQIKELEEENDVVQLDEFKGELVTVWDFCEEEFWIHAVAVYVSLLLSPFQTKLPDPACWVGIVYTLEEVVVSVTYPSILSVLLVPDGTVQDILIPPVAHASDNEDRASMVELDEEIPVGVVWA